MANVFPLDLGQNYRKPPDVAALSGGGANVVVPLDDSDTYDASTNTVQIEVEDGNVQISFGKPLPPKRDSKKFDDNLAELLTESDLSTVAEKLLMGIEQDIQTRSGWMENLSSNIKLLGLEVKAPSGAAAAGAPAEGTSTVDHPLLLEAVLRFQANARGELLPTDGPVKVRNDGEENTLSGRLAQALEKDMNHYLTKVAKEYYPDTDRMLLLLGFCGISFKEGYHCPIKRRPVIVSVDAKDLIVSNATTDLDSAGRVTRRVLMRPSMVKRMQLIGAYRNIHLPSPGTPALKNPVDQTIDRVQGIAPSTYQEPEDQDREFYQTYCELELPGFEHEIDGHASGLPLPYKVVLDKESRQVLEIRRNWDEEDAFCMPINRIIAYTFIPGLGFYGIGLLNVLGNATKAVTAAWRLMIDAGMYANFPGFLYLKSLGKQLTNQFRIPPGGGMPIDTVGNDIRASVMPLPYKDPSAVFIQLIDNISEQAQRVGGTAELQIGEGKQDAPVGTTLAMIEQATKLMSAVHKRLHQAQGTEFDMLKDLLKEDPEALWRHNKKSAVLKMLIAEAGQNPNANQEAEERHRTMFLMALDDCSLVPAADPNTSSMTERYLKVVAMRQMAATNPNIDINAVDKRAFEVMGIDDSESYFKPPPDPSAAQPSPEEMTAQATQIAAQARLTDSQTKKMEADLKARTAASDAVARQRELDSKEKIASLGVARELVIHNADQQAGRHELGLDQQNSAAERIHKLQMASMANRHAASQAAADRDHQMQQTGLGLAHKTVMDNAAQQHEANQSGLDRLQEAFGGAVDRHHERIQGIADQQHEHIQSGIARQHEAEQAELSRRHEAEMAEHARKAAAPKERK